MTPSGADLALGATAAGSDQAAPSPAALARTEAAPAAGLPELAETVAVQADARDLTAEDTIAAPMARRRASAAPDEGAVAFGRGDIIGRYVVLTRLGAGAMGVVFAAYDPELDRKVAIKLLKPHGPDPLDGSAGTHRLLREAQALARLNHTNVVGVHDVGVHHGQVFVAMEFVEGMTLSAWLAARRRSWREVVRIFTAAGRGLEAAHAAGIVHRDFKPKSRRPSPTAPQPTDRPHSHDLGRFERVGAYHATPVDAWILQVLAKRWQRSGLAGESWGLSQRSTARWRGSRSSASTSCRCHTDRARCGRS